MKKLIAAAKENGAVCRAYLCGSDPSSLDAVTLEKGEKRIAVIDGTSPHAYDARYPGAVSRILDCAAFLDGNNEPCGFAQPVSVTPGMLRVTEIMLFHLYGLAVCMGQEMSVDPMTSVLRIADLVAVWIAESWFHTFASTMP